jgi:hypothetical protein
VVEKSLSKLEDILLKENNICCNVILKDVDEKTIENNISEIQEAKR